MPSLAAQAGYLFPEIGRRRNAFLADNPDANIISLGIGDTTLPVPEHILNGLQQGVSNLGAKETYTGYGAEQGVGALRNKISEAREARPAPLASGPSASMYFVCTSCLAGALRWPDQP